MRQLAGTSRVDWSLAPEPVGRLGSDHGRDVRAWERVPALRGRKPTEREWRYQLKRVKEIGQTALGRFVNEAIPDHSDIPYALVIAVACRVSNDGFAAFHDEAHKLGVLHHELWSRDTLNDKLVLNENARIAAFYFGDGPAIEGTVPIPITLDRSAGRDLSLLGRGDELAKLQAAGGDVILVGQPGSGKSRLAAEAKRVRFITSRADPNAVAESLRQRQPAHVVLDDAGLAIARLEMLLELRREGHSFAIVATTWAENLDEVKRWLPDAAVIGLPLLERKTIDDLLTALGIKNYYLRLEILDQAEGRPGWAVALADLAKRGRGRDIITGRAIIGQVEPYLARLGASSKKALGLLSMIGALGSVSLAKELTEVEAYVAVDRLEGQQLLQDAAAAGVLELLDDALRISPKAFRFALVGHWFFEQRPAPWPIDDLLTHWPDHRDAILLALLEAAWDGSDGARDHLDELLPSVAKVPYGMLDRYVALDKRAAERAIVESDRLPELAPFRTEILTAAASRFALPEAVRKLLDLAVGDVRPEHSNPSHPIRVLGEVGSRVSPHGDTSFDFRKSVADTVTEWFDADPSPAHQLVWAKVMAHLLDPKIEGSFADPGLPMTINLRRGFETAANVRTLTLDVWPLAAARLGRLATEPLIAFVQVVDDWLRLARRIDGVQGVKPTEEAASIAASFVAELLLAMSKACEGKPAAQVELRATASLFAASVPQRIDPEFRLLTWSPWHLPRRGESRIVTRIVGRLADCWALEDPADLMKRIAGLSAEAAHGRNGLQMIHVVFRALADRSEDLDGLTTAGLDAGLTWEIYPLMKASIDHILNSPPWLPAALAGPARATALGAALEPGPNRDATESSLAELGPHDVLFVEQAMIRRNPGGHDWVSLALLRHPIEEVRGTASLWFGLDASDHAAALPADWYPDWKEAFVVAPLLLGQADTSYRLGEQLTRLVVVDPGAVERWLTRQLVQDPHPALHRLPKPALVSLSLLPVPYRDRLMREVVSISMRAELLSYLLGDDMPWLGRLLDDGVVKVGDVLFNLDRTDHDLRDRIRRILALALVLVPRGTNAQELAEAADHGGWVGERSANFDAIRAVFDATTPSADPDAEAVRLAGVDLFEQRRDVALREERLKRVRGDF